MVERPFRYIREDFFLGTVFRDIDDLNAKLTRWLADVAKNGDQRSNSELMKLSRRAFPRVIRPLVIKSTITRRIVHKNMTTITP